ncbi:MAG TPA: hypothetical protein VJ653_07070 [Acidimicrobiales bacterium]|nr:hypothetical protein [Acidimicrobiales bacterium]
MPDVVDQVPAWFWDVPYVGSQVPGAVPRGSLREGGNCQLWAYELVGALGFVVGDLRSDDLWHDVEWTRHVEDPAPLDLVLFAASPDPWGAHVGVWTSPGRVAHLCEEVGRPAVWTLDEFAARDRYRVRIGCKRPVVPLTTEHQP